MKIAAFLTVSRLCHVYIHRQKSLPVILTSSSVTFISIYVYNLHSNCGTLVTKILLPTVHVYPGAMHQYGELGRYLRTSSLPNE